MKNQYALVGAALGFSLIMSIIGEHTTSFTRHTVYGLPLAYLMLTHTVGVNRNKATTKGGLRGLNTPEKPNLSEVGGGTFGFFNIFNHQDQGMNLGGWGGNPPGTARKLLKG